MGPLSHFDSQGASRMVDVGDKDVTVRRARASGRVRMRAGDAAPDPRPARSPRATCSRSPDWRGSWPPSGRPS